MIWGLCADSSSWESEKNPKNGQDCLLDRGLGSDAVRQIRTESVTSSDVVYG